MHSWAQARRKILFHFIFIWLNGFRETWSPKWGKMVWLYRIEPETLIFRFLWRSLNLPGVVSVNRLNDVKKADLDLYPNSQVKAFYFWSDRRQDRSRASWPHRFYTSLRIIKAHAWAGIDDLGSDMRRKSRQTSQLIQRKVRFYMVFDWAWYVAGLWEGPVDH